MSKCKTTATATAKCKKMIRSKYRKMVQLLDKHSEVTLKNVTVMPDYFTNLSYNELCNNSLPSEFRQPSQYVLWQTQSEVDITPILQEPSLIAITPPPKTKCYIDVSINQISDLLYIIDNHPYCPEVEYNIELDKLHKIKDELTYLNNMIGMKQLKQTIVNQLLYFMQDLHVGKTVCDFKHTVISGPPGTGKTEVARIIGQMYSKVGILKNNTFKKVSRSDLIAGYLGQTAIKTKQIITESLGGVLFIDEAYSLASSDKSDSYSKECIDVLCEALSEHKEDLMVIIAGYENELNNIFFKANPGLTSRFIWRFSMQPYTATELILMLQKMILDQEWTLDTDVILTDKWFVDKKKSFSSYGRDIEAMLTFIKIAHGRRIYGNVDAIKKSINMDDINNGYKHFLTNRIQEDIPSFGLYV